MNRELLEKAKETGEIISLADDHNVLPASSPNDFREPIHRPLLGPQTQSYH